MSVVQPRHANVVQPKSDFELLDGGQRLVYAAKTQSKGRRTFVLLLVFPLMFIVVISFFAGVLGMATSKSGSSGSSIGFFCLLLSFAGIAAAIFLNRWSKSEDVRNIEFDEKSISFDGKTYLLEHVPTIGWRSQNGYSAGGSGLQGVAARGAAQLAYEISGQIYMQYGADEILIISNLHPDRTEAVYAKIVGFLHQFGHTYGS